MPELREHFHKIGRLANAVENIQSRIRRMSIV
jgi:hypothetical protein